MAELSHLDQQGRARMVDVSDKADTEREAIAAGEVRMQPETLRLIAGQAADGNAQSSGFAPSGTADLKKGDVLTVAKIAGILAAKRTAELIPMCHSLPLTGVAVDFEIDVPASRVRIVATAKTRGKTGVEMEALTAVSLAALTIYDMAKAVDRTMEIGAVRLLRKSGGKSDLGLPA